MSWNHLRQSLQNCSSEAALAQINAWWFQRAWCAYLLHWDDLAQWPDPWQLLEEPRLCPLARGLGIMYTLAMLDREDFNDARLTERADNNLVLVHKEKYILNWYPDQIVNINPGSSNHAHHQFTLVQARQKIR
jgi:hypothetical protein